MQAPAPIDDPSIIQNDVAHHSDRRALLLASIVFSALTLTFAITSPGFIAADALIHYIFAKFAFAEPHYLTNVWGRPLCTALYAIPAAVGGRIAVRITSILLGLTCAAVTYRLALGLKMRWPVLAFVLTLGQPLLFLHSFSEMTELPMATLIALAFWAYQRRRFSVMAVLIALSPLARPEGLGFILLAAVALLYHRRWMTLLILPAGLILWNVVGWLNSGRDGELSKWLLNAWPYSANSMYPRGSIFQFIVQLPVVVSPLVIPALFIGVGLAFRRGQARSSVDASKSDRHLDRCRAFTAVIPLIILAVHSFLYATGKLGSYGEARYMLVVAPFWGLLAARGWASLWERFQFRSSPVRWAAAAVLLPLPIAIAVHALPIALPNDFEAARRAAEWYRTSEIRGSCPRIAASHPAVYYYLGISQTDLSVTADWTIETVKSQPAGTLLIWDPLYAPKNASADRAFGIQQIKEAGWVELEEADLAINGNSKASTDEQWHVFRSKNGK